MGWHGNMVFFVVPKRKMAGDCEYPWHHDRDKHTHRHTPKREVRDRLV